MRSRWWVDVCDNTMDVCIKRIYIPMFRDVNHNKCLKKLWKRMCKMNRYNDDVTIVAYMESEYGELYEMSYTWMQEEIVNMEEAIEI